MVGLVLAVGCTSNAPMSMVSITRGNPRWSNSGIPSVPATAVGAPASMAGLPSSNA